MFGKENASYTEFGMSFIATLLGLAGRRILQLRKFNVYICWGWAAFVSVAVMSIFRLAGVEQYHNALAACVLWLVPGVPLINGFIELEAEKALLTPELIKDKEEEIALMGENII